MNIFTQLLKQLRPKESPHRPGDFFKALRYADKYKDESKLLEMGVKKASTLGEGSGITGAYIIPTDYSLSLAATYEENAWLYPRCTHVTMTSKETVCPKVLAETAQAAGVSPFFGGWSIGWGGSSQIGNTITQSNPTFRQAQLTARDLLGTIVVSNQFQMDIEAGGEEMLLNLFMRGAAWTEEYAFLRGTGAPGNQPLGILNGPGKILVARATPNQINAIDIDNMIGTLTPLGWNKAIWACNPSALKQVAGIAGFIPNQNGFMDEQCAGFLLGRPVYVTEKLPILGTTGDLIFIDPSMYAVGERQEIVIAISDQNQFKTYQTVYKVWKRVDGLGLLDGPITIADGSTKCSPFVILQ